MVAFEALDAMLEKVPAGEEAVYRGLISACGRCGNSEKALAVVEVNENGTAFAFFYDSLVCSNLLRVYLHM